MIESKIFRELLRLLDTNIDKKKISEKSEFDFHLDKIKKEGLVLFGAGGFGKRTLEGLRKLNFEPLCFVDNNKKIWNSTVAGIEVLSPEEAIKKHSKSVFMLTIWSDVIGHPLEEITKLLRFDFNYIQIISFNTLYWKYSDIFLPYFALDLPHKTLEQSSEIKECYNLWIDEQSQAEYIAQLRLRINFDVGSLPLPVSHEPYIPNDLFDLSGEDVIIDCGAFNGDTLKKFISEKNRNFKQYYAYEPDPFNFGELTNYVTNLPDKFQESIHCYQMAISDHDDVIKFAAEGTLQSSRRQDGNIHVRCISLDNSVYDVAPTYIKMDVEGAEPEIIEGSRRIIMNYEPIIAISVYHKFDHLWKLPVLISQISRNYRFFLRPHCKAGWDLVCYAVPKKRSKK